MEVKIKTVMRYHLTLIRMAIYFFKNQEITSVKEGAEKLKPLYIAGGCIKQWSHCVTQFGGSSESYITYPFQIIYSKELRTRTLTDVCVHSNDHSKIIHKSQEWKQFKHPQTEENINKYMIYAYNEILFILKNEGNSSTCYVFEFEIMQSETTETQRTNIVWFHLYDYWQQTNSQRQVVN